MTQPAAAADLPAKLAALAPDQPSSAADAVDLILRGARELGASDVHLRPTPAGLDVRWRVDGVLREVALLPTPLGLKMVARLKVLAELLTYKTDVPQEGRIRVATGAPEMRLSTLPTLHGEKAVVRLFAGAGRFRTLDDLGLPDDVTGTLRGLLGATSGALLFCGPAGSGKTTTLYACLRELAGASAGRRSLATLEDPVEVALDGVAQSQANPAAGFGMGEGLRALLRQDPEVIAVGEIRDRATAEVAFQASLTGHLVLSTFHAGNAAAVVGRLSDMGIEPYLLRSGVLAIVAQRLARRLCDCSRPGENAAETLGLELDRFRLPVGCDRCAGTGYRGRLVLAEMLVPEATEVGHAILSRADVRQLNDLAITAGMIPLWARARQAVEAGITSPAEVRRTLGLSPLRPLDDF